MTFSLELEVVNTFWNLKNSSFFPYLSAIINVDIPYVVLTALVYLGHMFKSSRTAAFAGIGGYFVGNVLPGDDWGADIRTLDGLSPELYMKCMFFMLCMRSKTIDNR